MTEAEMDTWMFSQGMKKIHPYGDERYMYVHASAEVYDTPEGVESRTDIGQANPAWQNGADG